MIAARSADATPIVRGIVEVGRARRVVSGHVLDRSRGDHSVATTAVH